jgi:hypothetical protein
MRRIMGLPRPKLSIKLYSICMFWMMLREQISDSSETPQEFVKRNGLQKN